jgi:hypothetical protein
VSTSLYNYELIHYDLLAKWGIYNNQGFSLSSCLLVCTYNPVLPVLWSKWLEFNKSFLYSLVIHGIVHLLFHLFIWMISGVTHINNGVHYFCYMYLVAVGMHLTLEKHLKQIYWKHGFQITTLSMEGFPVYFKNCFDQIFTTVEFIFI